jgi:hypothetical protein
MKKNYGIYETPSREPCAHCGVLRRGKGKRGGSQHMHAQDSIKK